eukprot:jgi/Botrbrau1/21094/Bobra.0478s0001.1
MSNKAPGSRIGDVPAPLSSQQPPGEIRRDHEGQQAPPKPAKDLRPVSVVAQVRARAAQSPLGSVPGPLQACRDLKFPAPANLEVSTSHQTPLPPPMPPAVVQLYPKVPGSLARYGLCCHCCSTLTDFCRSSPSTPWWQRLSTTSPDVQDLHVWEGGSCVPALGDRAMEPWLPPMLRICRPLVFPYAGRSPLNELFERARRNAPSRLGGSVPVSFWGPRMLARSVHLGR